MSDNHPDYTRPGMAVSHNEVVEARNFGNYHAMSIGEAMAMIKSVGHDRAALDKAARDYTRLTDR